MSEQTLLTIMQIAAALVSGFLIARYTISRQRASRRVEYRSSMVQLIHRHRETPESIQITVPESIITGDPNNTDRIDVRSAYARTLTFKNRGNTETQELSVDVVFDDDAKILSSASLPPYSDAYPIEVFTPREAMNTVRILLPYLNPDSEVTVNILRTGEAGALEPTVVGIGKGAKVLKFSVGRGKKRGKKGRC